MKIAPDIKRVDYSVTYVDDLKIENIVPKNGTYLCNVSNISLQVEVYWREATQEEPAGLYMRIMQG